MMEGKPQSFYNSVLAQAALSEDEVFLALSGKEEKVARELAFFCQKDDLPEEDKTLITEVYQLYIGDVAGLIAQVEVEQHTLPRDVAQSIDELVQCMSLAWSTPGSKERHLFFEKAKRRMKLLQELLYVEHIDGQLVAARNYKREFRHFNGTIYLGSNERLQDCIQAKMGKLKGYKKERKKFFRQFSPRGELLEAPLAKPERLAEYRKVIDEVIKLYEDNYSKVVSGGYDPVRYKTLMWFLTWLIPLGLAIIGVVLLFGGK